VPPASIVVVFNHRGHKFIKKFELANFSAKYFTFYLCGSYQIGFSQAKKFVHRGVAPPMAL